MGDVTFIISDDQNRQTSTINLQSVPVKIRPERRNEERAIGLRPDIESLVQRVNLILETERRRISVGSQSEISCGIGDVILVIVNLFINPSEDPFLVVILTIVSPQLD